MQMFFKIVTSVLKAISIEDILLNISLKNIFLTSTYSDHYDHIFSAVTKYIVCVTKA